MQAASRPTQLAMPQHPGSESDSWIEVSSSPSSSEYEADEEAEIITAGLRIRRRRHHSQQQQQPQRHHYLAETILLDSSCSSLSSGGEGEGEDVASFLASQPLSSSGYSTEEEEGEEEDASDDNEYDGTVFSNDRLSPRNDKARLEMEHDAALRASLSTLLSCAAAARGLGLPQQQRRSSASGAVEGLRVVQSVSPPATAADSVSSEGSSGKSSSAKRRKRGSPSGRRSGRRHAKGLDATKNEVLRNTLITLAFSAGAIVLLSAVSFSAGYWVRRLEGGGSGVVDDVRRSKVRVAA